VPGPTVDCILIERRQECIVVHTPDPLGQKVPRERLCLGFVQGRFGHLDNQ